MPRYLLLDDENELWSSRFYKNKKINKRVNKNQKERIKRRVKEGSLV